MKFQNPNLNFEQERTDMPKAICLLVKIGQVVKVYNTIYIKQIDDGCQALTDQKHQICA